MKNLILLLMAFIFSFSVNAQIINPKETAKRKVEDRVNRRADGTIDKALGKLEEGIGSIFKRKNKKNQNDEGSNSSTTSTNTQNRNGRNSGSVTSNSKFDFEPGNKVLYFDNFERLNIGDFPAEFNTNASGEVVNVSGKSGKWLSMTKNGAFIPESIKELPIYYISNNNLIKKQIKTGGITSIEDYQNTYNSQNYITNKTTVFKIDSQIDNTLYDTYTYK